jgi:signal transduction histidine kinase
MDIFKNARYINKGLATLLAALFLITIASTVYLSKTLIDSRTLITNGTNTVSAILLLQDLELNLRTAESSQRGYIITHDTKHLEAYNRSTKVIPEEQKALANKSYAINKSELTALNSLLSQRLNIMQEAINIRDTQGLDAAVAIISANRGLETTNHIESLSRDITREKFGPFTGTIDHTQRSLKAALAVAVIMLCMVLIISLLILNYFQRAITKERATEGVKNEFLSLASHQLRTPASNVKQYLGLLLEGYMGKLKPQQAEALEVANKNNDIGIGIINDLLSVAKLDLEKIRLHKKATNLHGLVKEVVDEYRPYLKERKQTVKFERASKKVEVLADSNYLKSVFENLVDNASKYSPKRTHIYIRVEQMSKWASVSIRDEGVGIRRAEKIKLFKKFSRIPGEATHNVEGSGLGLYWVKRIVELHNGRISVKSRSGKGSTFIVELPVLELE